MNAVIFIGIQASGKSTFYSQQFSRTHLRLNLDMLKTRHREKELFCAALATHTQIVIDNTNPTVADRARYIAPSKSAGYRIIGYYFQSEIDACKQRNAKRPNDEQVPLAGLLGTYGRLEVPKFDEGFDELFYVRIKGEDGFTVEAWRE